MEKNTGWKRIVYLMCAIQVGAGIAMIGVMAFLPLFLGEIGVTDAGEAAFWAGLISGVTPFMIALSRKIPNSSPTSATRKRFPLKIWPLCRSVHPQAAI